MDEGFILDKKIGVGQPIRMENAKILVANTAMDTDKIKIYGARVRVNSMAKVGEIEKAEKEKMRAKCQRIINHGINCFINRQLIYNFPEEIFADAGVMAIEHADFDGEDQAMYWLLMVLQLTSGKHSVAVTFFILYILDTQIQLKAVPFSLILQELRGLHWSLEGI